MPILALIGSGEFTPALEPVDKFLLAHTPNPKVAILPTAAGLEPDYQKWISDGIKHFKKLGINATGIHLLNRTHANNHELTNQLTKYNFVYFSGGDPGHLLDTLKGSLAWQIILNQYKKGATLAGSSAGAMVLGKMVWARVYDFINSGKIPPWEPGLNLVPFGVIPHYDAISKDFSPQQISQIKSSYPPKLKIIGIDENTAYIKISNTWKTLGEGTTHQNHSLLYKRQPKQVVYSH